jgi:hypothetical protein
MLTYTLVRAKRTDADDTIVTCFEQPEAEEDAARVFPSDLIRFLLMQEPRMWGMLGSGGLRGDVGFGTYTGGCLVQRCHCRARGFHLAGRDANWGFGGTDGAVRRFDQVRRSGW